LNNSWPPPDLNIITVGLENRHYNVLIAYDWLELLGEALHSLNLPTSVMVFTSPRVGALYYGQVQKILVAAGFRVFRHDILDGEGSKNQQEYDRCLAALVDNFPASGEIPLVLVLGGGMLGDLAGFVAATYRRGVPWAILPTTLLACVDSSIGGKVGYNYRGVKNLIGTIHQPRLVFTDLKLLETLEQRELKSGLAEIIKAGAVCDVDLFTYLEANLELLLSLKPEVLETVVSKCCFLKAKIVEQDEYDQQNQRVVLNFGHTIGHALELAVGNLTHGEGISIGMIAASRLAIQLNLCPPEFLFRLRSLIRRAGLPEKTVALKATVDSVIETMNRDKKFKNGQNRFVLPTGIGSWQLREKVDPGLIRGVIQQALLS
jgi:3-dehydroquinate synthase